MGLTKIEVITGMSKFTSLKHALSKAGVGGMTFMQVLGCGVEKGTREYEVDEQYEMELLPKQQINIVVEDEKVDDIVELINRNSIRGISVTGRFFCIKLIMQSVCVLATRELMHCRVYDGTARERQGGFIWKRKN